MGQAEGYLDRIPMWIRKKNSLKDVRRFLNYLGNLDWDRPAIHMAGTNGKGSAYTFLASVLEEAGYSANTFIPPHLAEVCERSLINGRTVDQENLEGASETILETSRKFADQRLYHPTSFESLFYVVMALFRMCDADMMIPETGMGDRLDITNVLERPAVYVITSIDTDYTRYLDDTLAKIAGEKAGITRTDVPLILDDGQPEVSIILEGFASRREAARYSVERDDFHVEEAGEKDLSIDARMKDGRCLELGIPFKAFYQAGNAVLAVCTLDVLRHPGGCSRTGRRIPGHGPRIRPDGMEWRMSDQHIVKGLKSTFWPGCMEQMRLGVCLSGAHNPGGIEAFIQAVGEISDRQGKKPRLLSVVASDKNYERMAEQLCREAVREAVGVVHINSDRGLTTEALARVFRTYTSRPVYSYGNTRNAAWDMAEKSREGLLFCAGPPYLIDEIKAVLE